MLSYHFTLFLLSALLVYFVLMCRHRTADVGLSCIFGGLVLTSHYGRGFCPGASTEPDWCQRWLAQVLSKFLWNELRKGRSGPDVQTTGRQQASRETNSKFESIYLKGCDSVKVLLSAVARICCSKGFCRDQGVADVDWEKGESRREMGKQSNGGRQTE